MVRSMLPSLELTIADVVFQPTRKHRQEYCCWCTRLRQCFSLDGMRYVYQLHQHPSDREMLRKLYLDMQMTMLRYFLPRYHEVDTSKSVGEEPRPSGHMPTDYENVLHLSIRVERMKSSLYNDWMEFVDQHWGEEGLFEACPLVELQY